MYTSLEPLLYSKSTLQGFIPTPFWESMAWKSEDTGREFFEDRRIRIIEENFKKFCEKTTTKDYSKPPINSSIPPIIHFIWLGSPIPSIVNEAIGSWKRFHPEWEFRIWTDLELVDFSWSKPRFKLAFEEAKSWAEKSDILRYEVLLQFGGIYSDTDVVCLKSFHDLITNGVTFFAGLETNVIIKDCYDDPLYTGAATMGAAKGSSVIQYCLDHYKTLQEAPTVNQIIRGGPGLLSQACSVALDSPERESILILPCSYLYPLSWKNRWIFIEDIENFIASESLTVHLWEGSWLDYNLEHNNAELLPFENFDRVKHANASQLKFLIETHSIRTIVEAGSHFGLSTRYMAKLLPPGGKVYAVDHWFESTVDLAKSCQQFQSTVTNEDFANAVEQWLKSNERLSNPYQRFLSKIEYEGLSDVIIPLRMKSIDGPKHLSNTQIDLVYINTHDEESVYSNLSAYYPLIQRHGILCGDNFNSDKYPGIVAGVKRFVLERSLSCTVHEHFWCINEMLTARHLSPFCGQPIIFK